MSYPSYPSFSPITVMNWSSYDKPSLLMRGVSSSHTKFLEDLMQYRGGWVRCSKL